MYYWREPRNFEKTQPYYLVVGYYCGKAIIKDEWGDLYYVVCEENEAETGTLIEPDGISRIEGLSAQEQESIQKIYRGEAEL